LGRNLISNAGGYLLSIVIAFVVSPITIHNLGDSRYGAWSLVGELIGYYGLLDLGLRGALTYYVARLTAREKLDELNSYISTAFWVLVGCGTLAAIAGVAFAGIFPHLFTVDPSILPEVRTAILIMSLLIALGLPMNTFSAILVGHQRFDLVNGVEISIRAIMGVSTYWSMRTGGGLVSLALIQAGGRALGWTASVLLASRVGGTLRMSPRLVDFARIRELSAYGLRTAVGQIAQLVINRMDLTVVGMFAGIQFVTFYSVGSVLVGYAVTACYLVAFVFTPQLTQLEAKSDREGFLYALYKGLRLSGTVAAAISAGLIVFGRSFLSLWVGAKYVESHWNSRSDLIMMVLLLSNAPRLFQSVSRQALYATARVRFLMWLDVSEAVGNVVLSVILVRRIGPIGVALGTLVPLAITQLCVLLPYFLKVFKIQFWTYIRRGLGPPLLVGIFMVTIGRIMCNLMQPYTWLIFASEVLITTACGALVASFLSLTSSERKALLKRTLPKASGASQS
jgi:O-antigen/teichoic acid export membrane protein